MNTVEARRLEVHGVVQGVGFRPFVWRLAERFGLRGRVRNMGGSVRIHVEGPPASLDAFAEALMVEAPPRATIDDIRCAPASVEAFASFEVDASRDDGGGARLVAPDAATCSACLGELLDPDDRRYRYPFINCTDCGPRFTIIGSLPYDRERTSMRAFPMCDYCRREYEDPSDRRFHAEPIACPTCGPSLRLSGRSGEILDEHDEALATAARLLRDGAIVAVKGLGGFHLACDATDDLAVSRLRTRKHRPDKPFAVMVAGAEDADAWFEISPAERDALVSWRAPIVLVGDRGRLAPSVAPGYRRQGAMLPATPVHHLLLRAVGRPLVMTSGNRTDEPICIDDGDALVRLAAVADAFLLHDRRIVARYDDAVVRLPDRARSSTSAEANSTAASGRADGDAPLVLRRARSFAPSPIALTRDVAPTLGTGALLNGAFCLAAGRRAFLSQHVGDLDSEEAMGAYHDALDRYREVFRVDPEAVAHDLHPDFMTTRFAQSLGLPSVAVQHHHAHIAATMAEHGLQGEVLGIAMDGFGYGDDGTVWGGELLVCDAAGYRRVGRLRRVRQPGGDAATRDPVRMALAYAADAGVLDVALALLRPDEEAAAVTLRLVETGLGSPLTSSAGRLFDAVAALAGVCRTATYEGQAAMLLEQTAMGAPDAVPIASPVVIRTAAGPLEIDTRPLIAEIAARLRNGAARDVVAAGFQAALAEAVVTAAQASVHDAGIDRVALGGGVFSNDAFSAAVIDGLTRGGLRVFLPREVPVGDGGIALGQVLVANAKGEVA